MWILSMTDNYLYSKIISNSRYLEEYDKKLMGYSKKKRLEAIEGKIRPTKKDLDNIAKAVLDGLNTKAFIDDRYIVGLTLEKMYADDNRIDVIIEEAI